MSRPTDRTAEALFARLRSYTITPREVEYLLDGGANLQALDHEGKTPLVVALNRYDPEAAIIRALLDCIRAQSINISDNPGNAQVLHHAISHNHLDIVKDLLDNGADIEALDERERTPLVVALTGGEKSIARLIIAAMSARGINISDNSGNAEALPIAALYDHLDIVRDLLDNGADTEALDEEGATPLVIALSHNKPEIASLLIAAIKGRKINISDNPGNVQALHYAISDNHHDVVNDLLDNGADVEALDEYGETPLVMALYHNKPEIARLIIAVIKERRINISYNSGNAQALPFAISNGHLDIVKDLLDNGADIEALDHRGATPLMAAIYYGNKPEIAKLIATSQAISTIDFNDAAMDRYYRSLPANQREEAKLYLEYLNSTSKAISQVLTEKWGLSSRAISDLIITEDNILSAKEIIAVYHPDSVPDSPEFFELLAEEIFQLKNTIGLEFFRLVNSNLSPDKKITHPSEVKNALDLLPQLDFRYSHLNLLDIANGVKRNPSDPIRLDTLVLASVVAEIASNKDMYSKMPESAPDSCAAADVPAASVGEVRGVGLGSLGVGK